MLSLRALDPDAPQRRVRVRRALKNRRPASLVLVALLALTSTSLTRPALAQQLRATAQQVQRPTAGGGNLVGLRGLLRSTSALMQPAGFLSIGMDFQFFSASGLYRDWTLDGTTAPTPAPEIDHSRMVYSYSIGFTPSKYFETAFAFHVTSDDSTNTGLSGADASQLQVAVGDPQLVLKGGYEIMPGLGVGALLDVRFPAGAGFNKFEFAATSVLAAALATYRVSDKIPLGIHLNVGYFRDGSKELFSDPTTFPAAQRFAAQYSKFDRMILRLGLEYETKYVGPFVELSLEPFIGSGAPGFGDSPGRLSIGARGWIGKRKNVQLLAAVDVGLTGVGPDQDERQAFVIPSWNLALRLSYRFDVLSSPEVHYVSRDGSGTTSGRTDGKDPPPTAPKLAVISGKVVDSRTGQPIWNARVSIPGETTSSLAVDSDGTFHTFRLPVGPQKLKIKANGYKQATIEVSLKDGGVTAEVKLEPRQIAPASLEILVRTVRGRPIKGATVLIPQLNQTLVTDRSGKLTVNVKPGTYKLIISKRGYRTQRKTERVDEGTTRVFNIELHR